MTEKKQPEIVEEKHEAKAQWDMRLRLALYAELKEFGWRGEDTEASFYEAFAQLKEAQSCYIEGTSTSDAKLKAAIQLWLMNVLSMYPEKSLDDPNEVWPPAGQTVAILTVKLGSGEEITYKGRGMTLTQTRDEIKGVNGPVFIELQNAAQIENAPQVPPKDPPV